MKNIKLKDLRHYISKMNPISIFFFEKMKHEDYELISDVPTEYDELYVYGIGTKLKDDNNCEPGLRRMEIVLAKYNKEYVQKHEYFLGLEYVLERFD